MSCQFLLEEWLLWLCGIAKNKQTKKIIKKKKKDKKKKKFKKYFLTLPPALGTCPHPGLSSPGPPLSPQQTAFACFCLCGHGEWACTLWWASEPLLHKPTTEQTRGLAEQTSVPHDRWNQIVEHIFYVENKIKAKKITVNYFCSHSRSPRPPVLSYWSGGSEWPPSMRVRRGRESFGRWTFIATSVLLQ